MQVKAWISKHAPDLLIRILRPLYDTWKRYSSWIASYPVKLADSLRIIGPEQIYDEEYYAGRKDGEMRLDAQNVSKIINDYYDPNSVIDFGCAIGAHLEAFYESDADIKGIEGNSKAFDHAVVPTKYLQEHDLRDPFHPDEKYDLALCFEVAEHLPEKYADTLVNTLIESSDTIIMSAATPGQGGAHHVNEQPREYWYQKFSQKGYTYDKNSTQELRDEINVTKSFWIPKNLMIFKNEDAGSNKL